MIVLLRDLFKISEKKSYKKGDKPNFGEDENKRMVEIGAAEYVKETKVLKPKLKNK